DLLKTEYASNAEPVLRRDGQSINVTDHGALVYGPPLDSTRYLESAPLHGDLSHIVVTAMVSFYQLPEALTFPFSHERLITNGLFIIGTMLTMASAILFLRRAGLLAEAASSLFA